MSEIAVRLCGLGKKYNIGRAREAYTTLGECVVGLLAEPIRRAGSLLRGQPIAAAGSTEAFWALKNLSLEIAQGEVLGIIGHNGAGKSTLLRILSEITEPTEGYVEVFGRVGSLLEVGTGFHPELTGRDNIFLNGAILGMRREEIRRKFDEIVAFSEIEKFLDTPVKHYSSGMYVRLAFAVAAHLQPEILLVDEVLAVGDLAFQKKCLGKMDDVTREGRTILFVSHNLNAVQRLCTKSILLSHGRLVAFGNTADVVKRYLASSSSTLPGEWVDLSSLHRTGTRKVRFAAVCFSSHSEASNDRPFPNGPVEFVLDLESDSLRAVGSVAVTLYDQYGTKLVNADTFSLGESVTLQSGHNFVRLRIRKLHLNPGIYTLGLWAADPPNEVHDSIPSALRLEVVESDSSKIRLQADGIVPCPFELLEVSPARSV